MNYYDKFYPSIAAVRKSAAVVIILSSALALTPALMLSINAGAHAAASKRRPAQAAANPANAELGPNATPLDHNNRAVQLGKRGLWDKAVEEHEAALNGDPYNPTFRMNLSGAYLRYGQALMAQGQFQQAIKRFHMALYVDPNNMPALECCSTCWKNLRKDPDNPDFRREMGEKYETEGDYPEAIAEYRQYVRIVDSGPAHAALGRALAKQGQNVPARAVEGFNELKIAVSKDWAKDQQVELGKTHLQLAEMCKDLAFKARDDGRTDTALKRLENASIEYRRAAQLMNNANLEGARGMVEVAREGVGINPRSFDNHLTLACGYQLLGDFERAKKEYEACWKLRPNDPALAKARRSYHRAVVTSPAVSPMLVAGSVQKVEEMLKAPGGKDDAELLYIYGRGKEALGDHQTAMAAYQRAYSINPYIDPDLARRVGAAPAVAQGGTSTAPAARPGSGQAPSAPPQGGGNLFPPAGGQAPGGGAVPPSNDAVLASAQSKINGNDLAGAEKDLNNELEKNAQDGKAWMMQGAVQEKKGSLEDASVAYRQATYFNVPGSVQAMNRIDDLRAKPLLEQGDKLLASKDLAGARDAFRQAASVSPNSIDAHRRYLEILKQVGDPKEIEHETQTINNLQNPNKGGNPQTGSAGASY
ncbi:MAG TPA: tetratricopeptide repeat protein [Planktothrix sp.]